MASESWVSAATRRLIAPTPLANYKLAELLKSLEAGERKAFWLAVALVDQKITVDQAHDLISGVATVAIAHGPVKKKRKAQPGPRLIDQHRRCEKCDELLPAQKTGRPRRYHPECRAEMRRQLRRVS